MICGKGYRYKALMTSSAPNIDRALTILNNDSLSLKNTTQHPITLKSLFTDDAVNTGGDKYWKTLGGKYLSIGESKTLNISVST